MTLLLPARAVDVVDRASATIIGEHRDLVERFGPPVEAMTQSLVDGGKTSPPPPPLAKPEHYQLIVSACQNMSAVRQWRRHRVIYTLDGDLAREVALTDPDSPIPGGLVRQLPHPNPFLALPVPIRVDSAEGGPAQLTGAFLYGVTRDLYLRSTDHPEAAAIGLLLVVEHLDGRGRQHVGRSGRLDYTWSRLTLPPDGTSPREAARYIADRVRASKAHMKRNCAPIEELIVATLADILPMVMYLCAVNAERRTAPAVATRRRVDGSVRAGKAPQVVEHGFWLGPALSAARRRSEGGAGTGTGRRMRPHVRRAHWHTYRTGEGRTDAVLHWLPPIPINAEGDAAKATVVPVATKRREGVRA